jgi:hypothetical protein
MGASLDLRSLTVTLFGANAPKTGDTRPGSVPNSQSAQNTDKPLSPAEAIKKIFETVGKIAEMAKGMTDMLQGKKPEPNQTAAAEDSKPKQTSDAKPAEQGKEGFSVAEFFKKFGEEFSKILEAVQSLDKLLGQAGIGKKEESKADSGNQGFNPLAAITSLLGGGMPKLV